MAMAKLKTKNQVNTSVIEITDDEDSRSPVKNNASLNNDEYRIGANIADDVCLSSTDMDLLDSSLNAKQEYVKAMQKLSQNLQQIESVRTPISTAKLPIKNKSTGKFKFTKPKSAATEAFASTSNTSISSSTIISTKNNVKPTTIPAMFKTALSQSGTEKRKQPEDDAASSKKVEECSSNQKNNGTIKTDDDDYSFSRK
jgi:hypothetical protein